MHARTGTIELSPDRIDDAVAALENEQLPRYRETSGYKGFTVLANRSTGKVIGVSFWESEDDLRASEQLGSEARQTAKDAGGGQDDPVREDWEVLLDDMV